MGRSFLPLLIAALLAPAPGAAAECALVASGGLDALTVVDLASQAVTAQIPTGERAVNVIASADGRTAYVANHEADSVSVVDLVAGEVTATIAVGARPLGLALAPGDDRLYVVERNANRVAVVDLAAAAVVDRIDSGGLPAFIAVAADGRTAWVSEFAGSSVGVLDLVAGRRVAGIGVGAQPYALALAPDGARLYVTAITSADVSVVDTASRARLAAIPVGGFPSGIAIHPSGRVAYVADAPEGGVTVLDLVGNRVETTIALAAEGVLLNAPAVAMNAAGNRAVVAEFLFGNLYLLDTARHALDTFLPIGGVGSAPEGVAVAEVPGGCPRPPTPRLTADLPADGLEMVVDRPDALPLVGTARLGDELIGYRSRFAFTLRELSRGLLGSLAIAHPSGTLVHPIRPGDANCDTATSAADLSAIAARLGGRATPGPCGDDADGNRLLEPADLRAAVALLFAG